MLLPAVWQKGSLHKAAQENDLKAMTLLMRDYALSPSDLDERDDVSM